MTLTVTPELNLKQNIVGWGNVDTAAIWETPAMQPELNKGKFANRSEKRDCIRGSDPGKNNLSVKENLQGTSGPWKFKEQNFGSWFQLIEDMTTCQGIEKMLALQCKL